MGLTMSEPVTEKETVQLKNSRFSVGASSMQGWRVDMEDAHSLMLEMEGDKSASYFAVFDGHGGKEVARYASENLHLHLINSRHYDQGDYVKAIVDAFLSLDRRLFETYGPEATLSGSTAVCLLIVNGMVHCANLGDSRAVACVDKECVQLSFDHKPDNEEESKRIVKAGGWIASNRVKGNLALSRAFGDFHYKSNSLIPANEQMVSPCPDINSIEFNDKLDFLLLACDGIWDVLSNEEVVEFVSGRIEEKMEPPVICEQLMTVCLAPDSERIVGCDNMTVVLICYTNGKSYEDYCTAFASSRSLSGQRIASKLSTNGGLTNKDDDSDEKSKEKNVTKDSNANINKEEEDEPTASQSKVTNDNGNVKNFEHAEAGEKSDREEILSSNDLDDNKINKDKIENSSIAEEDTESSTSVEIPIRPPSTASITLEDNSNKAKVKNESELTDKIQE